MNKKLISYMMIITWGGYVYVVLELLFRQKSDITMMFCASVCCLPMIFLNNVYTYELDFLLQTFFCGIFCTLIELIFGLIFNSDHHIWDYSNMMFNYKGQVCLSFFFVWVGISIPIIMIIDWMEYNLFEVVSEPPYYKIFGKEVYRMKKRNKQ